MSGMVSQIFGLARPVVISKLLGPAWSPTGHAAHAGLYYKYSKTPFLHALVHELSSTTKNW